MAQEGDRDAFAQLYRVHLPTVSRLARFQVGADADDVTAEVFLRAWRGLPRYRETSVPFAAWLYGITRHVAVDELRRRGRSEPHADVPDRSVPPISTDALALREALRSLPDEQRRVVELKFLLGLTNAEVAEAMGTTPGAVNSKQWRAIRALAGLLEDTP
jgi:RNA polymerase sigma-70 factor, ECF subfamily